MSTTTSLTRHGITLPAEPIAAFCQRWGIRELAVFGSFLREDFTSESDIDVLIDPRADVVWNLDDLIAMREELSTLIRRNVELTERRGVEAGRNYLVRKHILATAEPIHVEG